MDDISSIIADRFGTGFNQQDQPVTEMINARLQRIQELERIRLEHSAEHTPGNGDGSSLHARRERLSRHSSQRTERRGLSNIQRTPVRSQSFDNTSTTTVSRIDEDSINFREIFENARQNIFGPRTDGSTESLNGGPSADSPVTGSRPTFQTGSDSGSGSSTPRTSSLAQFDVTAGLAEAFSNIRSSLRRSDSSGALGDMRRSSSINRETSSTQNIQRLGISNANGSPVTRSLSTRESRRESRFRRRTIQGVETNISRALEQERFQRTSPSVSRAMSPLVVQSAVSTSNTSTSTLHDTPVVTRTRETRNTSSFSSYSSTYSNRGPRKIDLYPEEGVPLLGFEDEKVIFVDNIGKCYWLNKTHPLIREIKSTKKLPEIVMKSKLAITNGDETDGYIAAMEGDDKARYKKLRELVMLARRRDANFENGDNTDSVKSLSLLELHKRGGFTAEISSADEIDEKYKSYSLYTEPRLRPDLESFLKEKIVLSLYDGIPSSHLPQEVIDREKTASETEQNDIGSASSYEERSRFSASQSTSTTESNDTLRRTQQITAETGYDQILSNSVNGDSASFRRTEAVHESSEAQSDRFGNEQLRYDRFQARNEQAELRYGDGGTSAILRQAEARRQQYLESRGSSENAGTILQRRAEERRREYLAEQQTSQNGRSVSQTRSGNLRQQFSSESRTDPYGSTIQRQSQERHESHTSTCTDNTENGSSSFRNIEQSRTVTQSSSSSMVRQSSQSSMVRQSSQSSMVRQSSQSSMVRQSSQSSMVRQSSQSSVVRQSSQTYSDDSDNHSEVNLVLQRLQMMQENPDMPIDTSHLDYEEMLSIQKALAENPSPPDSPIEFEASDANAEEIISVSDDENNRNQAEGDITDLSTAEMTTVSSDDINPAVDSVADNPETVTAVVPMSSNTVAESDSNTTDQTSATGFISARKSVITHSLVTEDLPETEENVPEIETKDLSVSTPTAIDSVVSTESNDSLKPSDSNAPSKSNDNIIEARTPRYQRLPSEGGEGRLPLPSMDWSPLQKCNSPLSPNRFSFEDRKSENASSASSTASDAATPSKFTVPKASIATPQTGSKSSVTSELTIEIPSDSPTRNETSPSQNTSDQSDMNKSDTGAKPLTSPLVRSLSQSSSEAPSPAGSETVTTVFEEFVQTIPLSVLQQYSYQGDDDDE